MVRRNKASAAKKTTKRAFWNSSTNWFLWGIKRNRTKKTWLGFPRLTPGTLGKNVGYSQCIKSPFFVQKFKLMKKLGKSSIWIFVFWAKITRKIWIFYIKKKKRSWKCCGYKLNSCWQLWFDEKNCEFFHDKKFVKMLRLNRLNAK